LAFFILCYGLIDSNENNGVDSKYGARDEGKEMSEGIMTFTSTSTST
jgi:hypothetical protein